jgi:hypothetical protein
MKWSRVLIYAAVLAAVLGYLYGVEIKEKEQKQAKEEESQKIVHLEKDKIVRVDLKSSDHGTIELRKPADVWVLTAPVKTKCAKAPVESLIKSAISAKPEKTILEKDVKWDEYGLDKPEFTITLYTNDDKKTELSFGASNPAKTSYYMRVDDQPKLLLVADTLKNALNKTALDLRDKSVLTIPAEDVDHVIISEKSVETELKREAPDRWVMTRPEQTRVKTTLIEGDIKSVTILSAKDIIDEPKKDGDPYGLDKPEKTFMLSGGKLQQTLEIGKAVDKKEKKESSPQSQPSYYARVKGQDTVYVVDGRILKMMKTDPKELKDRSVLSFNPNDIEKVEIELDGKTWLASRQEDRKWNLEKPEKREKMESWPISSMLWDIKDTEWKSLIRPVPADLASVQLDKPQLVARFFKKGEKEPSVLKAGWQTKEKKEPQKAASSGKDGDKKKEDASKPAEANPSTQEMEEPKTVHAMAHPQEERDAVMVLDGVFVGRLRDALKRLTEKE